MDAQSRTRIFTVFEPGWKVFEDMRRTQLHLRGKKTNYKTLKPKAKIAFNLYMSGAIE